VSFLVRLGGASRRQPVRPPGAVMGIPKVKRFMSFQALSLVQPEFPRRT
jgi:hypothetical protein